MWAKWLRDDLAKWVKWIISGLARPCINKKNAFPSLACSRPAAAACRRMSCSSKENYDLLLSSAGTIATRESLAMWLLLKYSYFQ